MVGVTIKIGAVGDPPLFPDPKVRRAMITGVGILEKGTQKGKTSISLVFEDLDGCRYSAQLAATLWEGISAALKGAKERFGDVE